jgi:hypothetical protein
MACDETTMPNYNQIHKTEVNTDEKNLYGVFLITTNNSLEMVTKFIHQYGNPYNIRVVYVRNRPVNQIVVILSEQTFTKMRLNKFMDGKLSYDVCRYQPIRRDRPRHNQLYKLFIRIPPGGNIETCLARIRFIMENMAEINIVTSQHEVELMKKPNGDVKGIQISFPELNRSSSDYCNSIRLRKEIQNGIALVKIFIQNMPWEELENGQVPDHRINCFWAKRYSFPFIDHSSKNYKREPISKSQRDQIPNYGKEQRKPSYDELEVRVQRLEASVRKQLRPKPIVSRRFSSGSDSGFTQVKARIRTPGKSVKFHDKNNKYSLLSN